MGKDENKRGSQKGGASKDSLKEEHVRLVKKEEELNKGYQDVRAVFQKLEETYQASKGNFSLQRYSQLKDMIKTATNESTRKNLQQLASDTGSASGDGSGKSGLASLLNKAKEFSGEAQQQQTTTEQATASGKSSGGKMSSFMKKLKNATGFSDEPLADEDVMSDSELQRDNARKQRAVQHLITQLTKASNKLEKLKHDYEASKSHAPPKRYQDLKDMIKVATAEKFT